MILLSLFFYFFFWWIWLKVCQFYLLKEPVFSFINLYYCFLISFSFISAQIFMIYFLLLILGAFLLFPVVLSVKLGCLFDVFLVSWGKLVLLWTFPLALLFTESHRFGVVVFSFCFYAYFHFFFDFFCDLLVTEKCAV